MFYITIVGFVVGTPAKIWKINKKIGWIAKLFTSGSKDKVKPLFCTCRRPISLQRILLSDEVREVFLSLCLELQMNCSCLIYLKLNFSLACCVQIQFKITALIQLCTGQLVSNSTLFYYAMKINERVNYFIANVTVKLRISVLDVQCIYFLC